MNKTETWFMDAAGKCDPLQFTETVEQKVGIAVRSDY
jgi:hypothetical protein